MGEPVGGCCVGFCVSNSVEADIPSINKMYKGNPVTTYITN